MGKRVKITIDGRPIIADEDENLVKVARANGIFVPSLCYHEHIVPPLGTCRVCMCKANGRMQPACTTKAYEGLTIDLHTDELRDLRRGVIEMMYAEGNHVCPGCPKSGNCDLQHMGYELGVRFSRFPHLFKDRYVDFHPKRLVIEHNRCIRCFRCVEDVLTDDEKRVFTGQNRGNETVIGIDYDEEAKLTDEQAAHAMELCPTGAIVLRGKESWAKPVGDRRFDRFSMMEGPEASRQLMKSPERAPGQQAKKTIATISLAGCFGCHMSILDGDLKLVERADLIEFNKSPLNDIKEFTKHCDLGLIEGGICNSDNVEVLKEFRKQCDILVCIGECSIWGGVPALRNTIPLRECLEETYLHCDSVEPEDAVVPFSDELPKLLDRVYACNEVVEIDYYIPGCPPTAEFIWKSVANILWGENHSIYYSDLKYD